MAKHWQLTPPAPTEFFEQFPELHRPVAQLLHNRAVVEPERIERFLSPDYEQLHDPYLFLDMKKAVERVWTAIEAGEPICIYGDYDADAVTANAVLRQTFAYLNVPVTSYIPDRFTEGYGLNITAFEKIRDAGNKLVLTVDCGTNSCDVADFCRENSIDLLITDHHEITGATPEAFALINPKNPADQYPDHQITGVGVAYKLASALLKEKDRVIKQKHIEPEQYVPEWDKWLLDLTAIGTVADCHSLLGENRVIVKYGLRVLCKTKWIGLKQLMDNARVDYLHGKVDAKTLGFSIAPRINAAGRLEHANIALDLLLATDFADAITLANRLEEINKRRQDLTARIVSEAKEQADLHPDRKVLVLSHRDWQKGLVGIVAGKLAEHYGKPVFVLERGETESTGSGRTGNGVDLVAALKTQEHLLLRFGGHKQAAGLTVATDKLDDLYIGLLRHVETLEDAAPTEPVLTLEAELREPDLTMDCAEALAGLEPFGAENPRPLFLVRRAHIMQYRLVGATGQHVQAKLLVGDTTIDAIGFNLAYAVPNFNPTEPVSLAGELITDSWNGMKQLKFKITDIKAYDEATHFTY
jgi:single-stranded-DNA-specific exonuclease